MPTAGLREQEWTGERGLLPYLLGETKMKKREVGKVNLFEKGLQNEIKKTDTLNNAVTKIVRMALCAEFGAALVKGKNADHMIKTITAGILSDAELRKQALIIINQFAK